MGGSNEYANLVNLTPEEHYIAHQMLIKIYPWHKSLSCAAAALWMDSPTTPRKNKAYGWIKKRLATETSKRMIAQHSTNQHSMLGRKHSAEAKAKISRSGKARPKKKVFCFCVNTGALITVYHSVTEAAQALGVHDQTIYSCIRAPGRKTAGGFSWSYENISPGQIKMTDGQRVKWRLSKEACINKSDWRSPAVASSNTSRQAWLQSDIIYNLLSENPELSFGKISKLLGMPHYQACKGPYTKIKSGWIPLKDQEWLNFKEKN